MKDDRREDLPVLVSGTLTVVWLALKIAPVWRGNLFDLVMRMNEIIAEPLHIEWCDHSLRAVFFCLIIYAMGIGIWLSTRRNYRRGEEHGSAKWGDARIVNRKYRQRPDNMNKILTQNAAIGPGGRKHRKNLNVPRWFRCRQDEIFRQT